MHSSEELTREMFRIQADGRPVGSMAGLIPDFHDRDRLGVVVRERAGGIWTSALIMATITAFYDEQRKSGREFFIYPDYFVFHAGCPTGDYTMLDVWPAHKSVAVEDSPEEILRAINDRAVNILVIAEGASRPNDIQRQTRNSALARLKQAFLCRPEARIDNADIRIEGNDRVESYVEQAIQQTAGFSDSERAALRERRRDSRQDNRVIEWYRRTTPEAALQCL